jgi:acetyl-CoA synthetase
LSPEFVTKRASEKNVQHFESRVIEDLQRHVRGLLAPYEYPKEIEFIEQLPMTTTGKVQRRFLRLQEEERFRQNAKM